MTSLRIVLVQPRNPLNILAAARAARNFGLGDIVVVDVQPRAWAEAIEKDVDRETPHGPRASSRGWLGDARKFDTLIEAIAECDWVLGTSSLERRRVSPGEVIELPALPARLAEACGLVWLPASGDAAGPRTANIESPDPGGVSRFAGSDSLLTGDAPLTTPHSRFPAAAAVTPHPALTRRRVAILFGSEKRGLTNEHLMYCHRLLRIPTAEGLPSMNLGQAVAVVCYELARSGVLAAGNEAARFGAWGSGFAASAVASVLSEAPASSGVSESSGRSPRSKGSGHSGVSGSTGNSAGSAGKGTSVAPKSSAISAGSAAADSSKLSENSEESWNAATAREKQALADYVARLLSDTTASSKVKLLDAEIARNNRNLIEMLTRLPLMSEDVRRIFKLIKDATSEYSETSELPRAPRVSRKPEKLRASSLPKPPRKPKLPNS